MVGIIFNSINSIKKMSHNYKLLISVVDVNLDCAIVISTEADRTNCNAIKIIIITWHYIIRFLQTNVLCTSRSMVDTIIKVRSSNFNPSFVMRKLMVMVMRKREELLLSFGSTIRFHQKIKYNILCINVYYQRFRLI